MLNESCFSFITFSDFRFLRILLENCSGRNKIPKYDKMTLMKPIFRIESYYFHKTKCWKKKNLNSISTLFEKSIFCPKIQFWQNPNILTSFSLKIFFDIWTQSCQQLKCPNHNIFTSFSPKKSTIFWGNQSWIFGQKTKISNSVIRYFGTFKY